ncbi:MAG TPA: hypothetical protein VIV60_23035 [Polyangiaceae bacterium]
MSLLHSDCGMGLADALAMRLIIPMSKSSAYYNAGECMQCWGTVLPRILSERKMSLAAPSGGHWNITSERIDADNRTVEDDTR